MLTLYERGNELVGDCPDAIDQPIEPAGRRGAHHPNPRDVRRSDPRCHGASHKIDSRYCRDECRIVGTSDALEVLGALLQCLLGQHRRP